MSELRDTSFQTGPFSRLVSSRTLSRLDLNLLGTAILIAAIGSVLVFSATAEGKDAQLFGKQLVWIAVGIVAMLIFTFIDYRLLLDIALPLWIVGILLLGWLLVWGQETAKVKSWIHLGAFQFQPSEFVKIFTVLLVAKHFDSHSEPYLTLRSMLTLGGIVGLPVVMIVVQPDFGTAATFVPVAFAAVFLGGIRPRFWIIGTVIALLAAPVIWFGFLQPYQKERVMIFVDPQRDPHGSGYQVMQSKIAIGSGGITGKGFREGTQAKLEYLPARHTDFIFAVLGEEWGFVGVLVMLTLYLFFITSALRIAKSARDRAGTFLAVCLTSFFIFHILINVGMQIGLLPTTGIPLPLVSYGGSSMLMFFIATGLILNVDYRKFVNVG
ncbi:MAG: rod shape-determining protein RodA [Thermoanaerobaculia bacterium]|jgi:rod shape determining protein RodA